MIKKILFLILIGIGSLASINTTIRFFKLSSSLDSPKILARSLLSPTALVYDRYRGFFTKFEIVIQVQNKKIVLNPSIDYRSDFVKRHLISSGLRYWPSAESYRIFNKLICNQLLESVTKGIAGEEIRSAEILLLSLHTGEKLDSIEINCTKN